MTQRLIPVSDLASRHNLDVSRLLFDLKRCSELISRFTGWLEADAIATCITEGLIEQFDCAFSRVWLVNPDRQALRLVASSGLYTRLDGSFAQVPMGAFKVGKIAQHCIPFLSNALSDEDWVKDRTWAIENKIQGFAGLPLMAGNQAIGVLAVFSHRAMAPEFLEVLQMLSLSAAGALASALNHQAAIATHANLSASQRANDQPSILSERLATIFGQQKLSLLGVEQTLSPAIAQIIIQAADYLAPSCHYCRLVYEAETVVLEAMLAVGDERDRDPLSSQVFRDLLNEVEQLGGQFQSQVDVQQTVMEVRIQLPQQMPIDEAQLLSALPSASPLSEREQEVMRLLAQGLRDREIAQKLFISERTVKFHSQNMLTKLAVKTRIQAVFEATRRGWL
ncbi:MAG: LuxR family transcriptional regulator [Phormidesmis priestleyi]|uniref:LuxR family transcriptional regulator n=1 Tax=Phormidesmis priestleyi TaxID=268141 RepID=A0A2W4XFJ5_9CYAN|nr:MAG: LuxR family transcriptional regulator [Phormidesmis priestleyi]